jgi:K+-sensing histidine kinase KdpD
MDEPTDDGALAATEAAADAAREALARVRAQRDELLVLAAHDLRNAAGIIESALGLLEDTPDAAPAMHAMMRRATHRLGILTRALVDVDLLERGVMPITAREVRWGTLVGAVVEGVRPIADTKTVTIAVVGDAAAALVCDAALVEKTLTALLDHAIGNAPDRSQVSITSERLDEGSVRIRIVQPGRAVPASALEKYCATLALRFCRLAALRHGGTLAVVSPIDDGTGVAFDLRIAA